MVEVAVELVEGELVEDKDELEDKGELVKGKDVKDELSVPMWLQPRKKSRYKRLDVRCGRCRRAA